MKNWNRTGKIKAVILAALFLPNLLSPVGVPGQQNPAMIFILFIFGLASVFLTARVSSKILRREIIKPTWNDNPLTISKPLSFIHFCSFFFLVLGASVLLGAAIQFHAFSFYGLSLVSFGLGMLAGIRLVLKGAGDKAAKI